MPREIALLTNPTSGRGTGAQVHGAVLRRLRDAGLGVRDLRGRDADESLDLARDAVAEGIDGLVVVGGDGMVHLALQAVATTSTTLGIIPAGTGNDVARYLGLPRRDPLAAADRVVAGRVRTIDLARTGVHWYATVLSAGFDALVNERANAMAWPRGQMRYNLATVAELRTLRPCRYTLDLDGVQRHVEAVLVCVGNGPSFGGGLRITEGAVLDDGLLDVVVIHPLTRGDLLRTYPRVFRGTHVTHPCYEHHVARRVTVATTGITAYADGERLADLPLTVECVPGALRVLC
ncbi:diacylglycerol kinase [Nocardioides sp. SYSU D00038]|uniref:diacylglycerol kinase n=1 Tax=Nocardioides sp. SYSU D00038 TaxID=2812554 RepID=UPI0019680350|nr:diacylglycerol kinase [Nocardioides sp. SYSU D00038]